MQIKATWPELPCCLLAQHLCTDPRAGPCFQVFWCSSISPSCCFTQGLTFTLAP